MGDILLVEDDPDIRWTLAQVLTDEGYRVRVAAHGKEAMAALETSVPSLVLLDILMPVMDGLEVIAAMRADARWAKVPIVVLSASSITQPPADLHVLRKPIGIADLLDAIKKHV